MLMMGSQEAAAAAAAKSQLAVEICELTACHRTHVDKSPFINWYLVLRVDENADVECIRKQYHKLALLVHPDKNKHSKAEAAFKLLSEAYLCLSDKARRAAFDSARRTISCNKCNTRRKTTSIPTNPPIRKPFQTSFHRIQRQIKQLREEAMIIEKCLTPNTARKCYTSDARTETPVFNPADYQHKGYPHYRAINNKLQDFMAGFKMANRWLYDADKNEYPVFQYQPKRSPFYV